MAMPKSYRPKECTVNIGGRRIEGYGEDEFVSWSMSGVRAEMTVGSLGEVVFSGTEDVSGTLDLTLLSTSESNDYMQDWLDRNERGPGLSFRPVVVRDLNGRAKFSAAHCTILESPQVAYGRTAGMRTWKLGFAARDPGAVRGS